MRLIDADALIDGIDFCVNKGMGSTIAFTFKHIVDSVPTIDAVEVVRCKDCIHSRVYGKTTQWLACESVMEQATDPDGYCYLGKRREE